MSETAGDKSEAPTPRRRQEAREQGNIARSQDLSAAALVIGAMVILKLSGEGVVRALRTLVEEMLGERSLSTLSTGDVLAQMLWSVVLVGVALAPMLVGVVVLAVLVNVFQVGFNLNGKRLKPNLGALNPLKGFGRVFGKGQGPVMLGMSVLKLLAVTVAAYSAIQSRMDQIIMAQQLEFIQIFALGADMVFTIGIRIGLVLLVLSLLDYAYQRWRVEQQLKMSKQEVKDEMRRMEGDPLIKNRRRQMAMHAMQQRMNKDVPTADVIVTNPTEFAIALKYDKDAMHSPRVVAKGQGLMAARIREIGIAHGVPILERKPLARALFKLCAVGQEIPEQFYSAVAEILAYVYELTGRNSRPRVAV